ncbi:MAG: hypothetical protein OCD01_01425 [Fibrobacterales bacterium]
MKHVNWYTLSFLVLFIVCEIGFAVEPLIMEHADNFRGSGSSGSYLLEGGIRFKRGDARFYTESATWDSKKDALYCDGGFRFRHPKGQLTAKSGFYQKADNRVNAKGNVVARDSASSLFLYGGELDYYQDKKLTQVRINPMIRRLLPGDEGKDDTLEIKAELLEFNDSLQVAHAIHGVTVTQEKMSISCDTAIYNIEKGELTLKGSPKAIIEQFEIEGSLMRIFMDKDTIRRIEVVQGAKGLKRDKSVSGSYDISEIVGDSLIVEFENSYISNLEVIGSAESKNYRDDRPEYINKMKGNALKMIMKRGMLDTIKIWEQASTLYHYFSEKGKFEGKNDAVGDTIWLNFKNRAISGFTLKGNVSQGIYSGEKKESAVSPVPLGTELEAKDSIVK